MAHVSEGVRAALLYGLYHHQGGKSEVGQPIRKILGKGQFERLSADEVTLAKRTQELEAELERLRAELAERDAQEPAARVIDPTGDYHGNITRSWDGRSLPEGTLLYAKPPSPRPAVPDVDALAQHIRQIDGNNSMGAGALAESIVEWISAAPPQPEADASGDGREAEPRPSSSELQRVLTEWLEMYREYVTADDMERWTYPPDVEQMLVELEFEPPTTQPEKGGDNHSGEAGR